MFTVTESTFNWIGPNHSVVPTPNTSSIRGISVIPETSITSPALKFVMLLITNFKACSPTSTNWPATGADDESTSDIAYSVISLSFHKYSLK